ncbi:hypothetical protein OsccyDRAFT_2749 [Leptolyngbyaceae cyanobacterium JSC-12]|nr:hypothetical protein OsccyDRAFT_2749 [Leptolyngbyaceae cyanobacterium JSC-12]
MQASANARVQPASQFGVEVIISDRIQIIIETLAGETSISDCKEDTLANTGIFKQFLVDTPNETLSEHSLQIIESKPQKRVPISTLKLEFLDRTHFMEQT